MKIPLSWLAEYISLNQPVSELAKQLTSIGLEVDAIEEFRPSFENVVVGKVVSAEKHPNADQLTVAKVTDGNEVYQVVCGAPNCRPGLKTAFCRVGGSIELEDGSRLKVKKAKIRGIESFGMLCSAKELGISEDGDGILEFTDALTEGDDLGELYAEKALNLSLTPNLGHCASVFGIARELSALTGSSLTLPSFELRESSKKTGDLVSAAVEDPKLCPRFSCRVIEGVTVAPSPYWMQERLIRAGMRPVNNVVDVTNYVLLELGHPLHAYDLDKIAGKKLVVRASRKGESLQTLDGKLRVLEEGEIVVADGNKAVALGGVMGGEETEVTHGTRNIVLESAVFCAKAIRRSAKRHTLHSESSRRFERGVDPEGSLIALDRAADLIARLGGGEVAKGPITLSAVAFPPKKISLRIAKANEILGTQLSSSEVETIFQKMRFSYLPKEKGVLEVEVPTFRVDIGSEIDLVEEVARFYGYDNIPKTIARFSASAHSHSPLFLFERKARERCIAEGLQEILTCDLISPLQIETVINGTIPSEMVVKVLNPSSQDQSILRPSMLPGLLQVVKYNTDRQNTDFSGFELGRIHLKDGEQFKEQSVIGIILTGAETPHYALGQNVDVDFYTLKGMVENILRGLGVKSLEFEEGSLSIFHPGRQAVFRSEEVLIGSLGELHPSIIRSAGIGQKVLYAEFNLHDILQVRKGSGKMRPIPTYPSSLRDWTITLRDRTPIAKIFQAIKGTHSKILDEVALLDIYKGERIGAENKNVTLRFVYRDSEKTVSQEEVDGEHSRLTREILTTLGKEVI